MVEIVTRASPKSEQETLDWVESLVPRGEQYPERVAQEESWFASMMYYAGQSGLGRTSLGVVKWNPEIARRFRSNKVFPLVVYNVSKLLQMRTEFFTPPKTTSREDIEASRVAGVARLHAMEVTGFRAKMALAETWAMLCGSAFLKTTWDPDRGEGARVWLRPDGKPDIDAYEDASLRRQLVATGRYRDVREGEIDLQVRSPFECYWDPMARAGTIDDQCEWFAEVSYGYLDRERERYGITGPIQAEDDTTRARRYLRMMAWMSPDTAQLQYAEVQTRGKLVRVVEAHQRPLKRNGWRGRRAIIVGNRVAKDGPSPYAAIGSPFPYAKLDAFPMPGRFIQNSLGEHLRPLQRARDESRHLMIETQRRHGYPVTVFPKGSNVAKSNMKGEVPGLVLEANMAMGAPIFSPPPSLPPYIPQNALMADQDMREIASMVSPQPQGSGYGQIRSGKGVELAQADRNMNLTPAAESLLECTAEVGRQMLRVIGHYYTDARLARVTGPSSLFRPTMFSGADLRGHYDVRVIPSPTPLESSDEYRARLGEMVEMGALNPMQNPEHQALILEAHQIHSAGKAAEAVLQHKAKAQSNVDRIVSVEGFLPPALPWEDHLVHMRETELILNSPDFEGMPTDVQKRLVTYWQAHQAEYQKILMAQMQMQAEMGGQQQKGRASPPKRSASRG